MNVGTSAVLLGKASRVLPSEKDLPSLPTIDLRKKRKQPKPGPSLPPSTSSLSAQQRRRGSRVFRGESRGEGRDAAARGSRGAAGGGGGGWSAAGVWKGPGWWWAGKEEAAKGAGGKTDSSGDAAAAGPWRLVGGRGKGAAAAAEGQTEGGGEGEGAAANGDLGELLALCRRIENECLAQEEEGADRSKGGEKENEFEMTKSKIEEILRNTHLLIETRQEIRAKKGTTLETVRLGGEIHDNITLLRELFNQLSAAYSRLFKQRKILRLSDEQLEQHHAEVCRLMRAIEEVRRESKRTTAGVGGGLAGGEAGSFARVKTLTELQQQPSGGGGAASGAASWWGTEVGRPARDGRVSPPRTAAEVVPEEDLAVIKRWKERDAEFDKQVAEIGTAIDRIADVTAQIGEKAEVQHELIQQVQQQTDKTTAELQQITQKVKDVIGKQSNMRFFTRLLLVVILLFLVCFVISVVYSRYIKN